MTGGDGDRAQQPSEQWPLRKIQCKAMSIGKQINEEQYK